MSGLVRKDHLSPERRDEIIRILSARFRANMRRHEGIEWTSVQARIDADPAKLRSLYEMESSGGEPDVAGRDEESGSFVFYDFSPESPSGRRNLCYDHEALDSRKENKPAGSAMDMADDMGIDLMTEEQYRELQLYGSFDTKTSSWLKTPASVRKLGGALFGDFRFGRVFVYHNGAQSYYSARGFRGALRV